MPQLPGAHDRVPLEELAEGDADDEVGYNLDEWEDAARGELIFALNEGSFRHRFEGDELVVAAEDEDDVDHLIANLGHDGSGGDADDLVPGQVLTKLADAARRLVVDPTDMIADGDLAEAAAGVFAIDAVWGVDEETWAAIGRVTRRLLGALGAEEALEEEIAESATFLSRMLRTWKARSGVPRRPGPRGRGRRRRPRRRARRRGATPRARAPTDGWSGPPGPRTRWSTSWRTGGPRNGPRSA